MAGKVTFFFMNMGFSGFSDTDNHLYFPMSTRANLAAGIKEMIKRVSFPDKTETFEMEFFLVRYDIYLFAFIEVKGKVVGCNHQSDDAVFQILHQPIWGLEGIPFYVTDSW